MKTLKIFTLIAVAASFNLSYAQDLNSVKKEIDAERYEKAKTMLKIMLKTNPNNGMASYTLGNIYLTQAYQDSAKVVFEKGLSAKDDARFNNIGLGQIDLEKGDAVSAQAKFALATKDMRKKDTDEYVAIGKAYMNLVKPDYKNAITILEKAKVVNSNDGQVLLNLGMAYQGEKNQNEAYSAYRSAYQVDPSLIRAKMQQGVLLKGARAFTEAVAIFDEIAASNPNYGPVYRELAETYYLWGNNDQAQYKVNISKALSYYEKYMGLTDYSLASRMRRADFLILAKDYKNLEVEANKMAELDKVNPRIFRYLGYSAYQNGNYDIAIKSLENFISGPNNKVISQDNFFLGMSKIKKSTTVDGKVVDPNLFENGIANLKKAINEDASLAADLSETGKKLYDQKQYKEASVFYELATTNKTSKSYLLDNFYLGNAIYFANSGKNVTTPDTVALQKADLAYGNVIEASPTTQDAYIYRARVNDLLNNDEKSSKYYQEYVDVVTQKGADELAKPAVKTKLIESYNYIGAVYANTDKAKAKEYFNKTLAIDPADTYATSSLKNLK